MTRDNQNKIPATLKRSLNVSACPTKIKNVEEENSAKLGFLKKKKKKAIYVKYKSYFSDHIKKVLGYTNDKEV